MLDKLTVSDRLMVIIIATFLGNMFLIAYTNWRVDDIVKDMKKRLNNLEIRMIGKR